MLDDAFEALKSYDWGTDRAPVAPIETAVTASHGMLDAMTDGGRGIAFFAPFDDTRYFLPFRPIKVSPIGIAFLSTRGLTVLWSEFLWVWIPATIIAGATLLIRRLRRPHARPVVECRLPPPRGSS